MKQKHYEINGVTNNDTADVGNVGNADEHVLDDVTDDDVRCGYGSCKPDGLQKLNNTKILVLVMCVFAFSQGT